MRLTRDQADALYDRIDRQRMFYVRLAQRLRQLGARDDDPVLTRAAAVSLALGELANVVGFAAGRRHRTPRYATHQTTTPRPG